MKVVFVVNGTPDEIAHSLVDENLRRHWDINSTSVEKKRISGDVLSITYKNPNYHSDVKETLKYTFTECFLNGQTTYLIHELLNDCDSRYYEI